MARDRRPTFGMIAGTMLVLIGAVAGIVPLFWHGWAHLRVTFTTEGPSGAQILRRLGIDVDRPIAAIAESEINRAIPPTLWQVKGHPFQIVAALLLLTALLSLLTMRMRWGQRFVSGVAFLAAIGAAGVILVALIKIRARFDALPDTIDAAIRASGVLGQVVGYTTGKPQVTGNIAWPIVVTAAGVALTVAGAALAFMASLRAARTATILPRPGTRGRRSKELAHGDTGRPAAISDN
jgi:hypothetical protein